MPAKFRRIIYNGITVQATSRRSTDRKGKKYERMVRYRDSERVVPYGDPNLPMRRNNPQRRANFLSRFNCSEKKDPFAPGFWACYDWANRDEESVNMAKRKRNRSYSRVKEGALADRLNRAISDMVNDDTSRSDVIAQMAQAADIEPGTVNQILNGDIESPPEDRLRGFARVLDISLDELIRLAGASESIILWREAEIKPVGDIEGFTGKEWEVTIIGPKKPTDIVTVEGERFLRSKNQRLYALEALKDTVNVWDGAKVYDNHLTDAEFQARQKMRSVMKEMIGAIVSPFWDSVSESVKGVLKIMDEALAGKLKNAYEMGILEATSLGLSIDTFPMVKREIQLEGLRYPVVEGFEDVVSVDLVAEPAAGGSFDRIIAATTVQEEKPMELEELKQLVANTIAETVPDLVKTALADAATAAEAETVETEDESAQETETESTEEKPQGDAEPDVVAQAEEVANAAVQEARLAQCALMLERKLNSAKFPDAFRKPIEEAFAGKIFNEAELDAMIKSMKEAAASTDTSGRVAEGTGRNTINVTIDEADKKAMMLMGKLMGESQLAHLETADFGSDDSNRMVQTHVQEANAYKSWINGGKPNVNFNGRVSELLRTAYMNDNWYLDALSFQEASTLATVIKNTVNIMTAVDYAGTNRWYEGIVDIIEVDNPIDNLTLARLFGADSLDVVNKGAAYTEMVLQDEEETSSHVKKGNYVAVPIEDLLADKIDFFRNLPTRLSDAWYNTLSAKVAAVFTVNSNTGPTLSDSGALFNNTAVTSAGGHANLLTTALSWSAFDTVVTAMYNQTARPLGTGRKLVDMGPFTILVPNALRATGNKIRNSQFQPEADASGTTGNQSINEYGPEGDRRPDVVTVPDWTDANDWAVLGRYRGASPIKLAFPRGMMTPAIFTADSELAGTLFTNDTIRYKLRMLTFRFSATFDCAPLADWRLLHKSNVA